MSDTDRSDDKSEHLTEEDGVDFARDQAKPERRARLARHLDSGCRRCAETVRLWSGVLTAAVNDVSYRPPDDVLRKARGDFAFHRPPGLLERVAERVTLVFDSFRQPLAAGVRATGPAPQQLLYKAGRYTIRLRFEPEGSDRLSIVGQILDELDPAGALRDIAVLALKDSETLDRTLTNDLGEFHLEPETAENLQLSVAVPEIGTFTVLPARGAEEKSPGGGARALDGSGSGKKRARPR